MRGGPRFESTRRSEEVGGGLEKPRAQFVNDHRKSSSSRMNVLLHVTTRHFCMARKATNAVISRAYLHAVILRDLVQGEESLLRHVDVIDRHQLGTQRRNATEVHHG